MLQNLKDNIDLLKFTINEDKNRLSIISSMKSKLRGKQTPLINENESIQKYELEI
jgi:hypothetical protein